MVKGYAGRWTRDASSCPRGTDCPNRGRNTENCPDGEACPISGHARPGATHASRGVGLRRGVDGREVFVLSDGLAEFSPTDAATVRAMTRATQERRLAFGDAVARINASLRTQLTALQASGVAMPRLLPGQLPAHIERNLDTANRSALGLSPQ